MRYRWQGIKDGGGCESGESWTRKGCFRQAAGRGVIFYAIRPTSPEVRVEAYASRGAMAALAVVAAAVLIVAVL